MVRGGEKISLWRFRHGGPRDPRAFGRARDLCLGRQHPPIAFVGDVIFLGSVGRTDFYDGDFEQLAAGIRAKVFTLPDETVLFSGHGPATTVGREKAENPYLRV